ncbi:mitochondrial intermembrane space protein, mature-T-Cell Proliferation I type ortholog, unknown biological role Cmc4 [Schizosaccharomyces pombe]|uniref:Cx9C motif-containing protein 4, mitochondrial n=1 Tax=Schizosaccharomyces pombe (strain 972 / ATCC 24843) TaxID=284812 RepID=CMC4_SCHPO|nr:protein Cmc4 [Schizosaccharomyces pombe]G2TRJ8.1 RecName: Full=Cx9C motif-containing protein 4, mitochondrial; AltName: Full=Transcripts altered in meiosis protein 2 [Schizosaccharomyces pombe 972h-]CCD31341.1 mitochondrial intermembrane space protein involved in respiratory growth Cmc4 [Schizosaccharomyces pombe]|eukprot:NP_001343131.1 protein Cmc4 [Schizosaccharomyces pombe]
MVDCQKEACNLQSCIQRNQYNQGNCEKFVNDLLLCCKRWYDKNSLTGNEAPHTCPELKPLLRQLSSRNLT